MEDAVLIPPPVSRGTYTPKLRIVFGDPHAEPTFLGVGDSIPSLGFISRRWIAQRKPDRSHTEFQRAHEALRRINTASFDYDRHGASPPNASAIAHAEMVLEALRQVDAYPSSIRPCPDDGVSLILIRKTGRATIDCYNNGEVVIACSRQSGPTHVEEVVADDSEINRVVRAYLPTILD